jgi:exodeoxyribonuclease VII small subunit
MTDSPPTDRRPPTSEAEPPQSEPRQTSEPPQTYEEAAARVEEIIRRLDSGEASLDETLVLVGEGKGLIELCARELAAVGDALQELRLDELVSRLEGETTGGATRGPTETGDR